MTTTTIDNLIAAFALAMIVVPIIILGIQDARRHSWGKVKNNKPTDNPNVGPRNQRPEPTQWKHYD